MFYFSVKKYITFLRVLCGIVIFSLISVFILFHSITIWVLKKKKKYTRRWKKRKHYRRNDVFCNLASFFSRHFLLEDRGHNFILAKNRPPGGGIDQITDTTIELSLTKTDKRISFWKCVSVIRNSERRNCGKKGKRYRGIFKGLLTAEKIKLKKAALVWERMNYRRAYARILANNFFFFLLS